MKRQAIAILTSFLLCFSVTINAAGTADVKPTATASAVHSGNGTVNSIDEKLGKVNISHEPIASLNWPAMTMNFQVSDVAILKELKPGMKIQFEVQKTADGYRLTKVMPKNAR